MEGIAAFILTLYKDKDLLENYKLNSRIASQDFTPRNAKKYYKHITEYSDKFAPSHSI